MDTKTKYNPQIIPPLVFTAIMLFVSLASLPDQYYTALRIIVTAASVNSAIIAYRFRKNLLILPFFIITILFNPLKPLSLSRNVWMVLDVVCGVFFLVSIFLLKEPTNKKSQIDK